MRHIDTTIHEVRANVEILVSILMVDLVALTNSYDDNTRVEITTATEKVVKQVLIHVSSSQVVSMFDVREII